MSEREFCYSDPEHIGERARAGAKLERCLNTLYDQACHHRREKQWQAALVTLAHIRKEDPGFPDPEGVEGTAQEGLRREQEVDALYNEARRFLERRQWEDAQGKVNRILEKDGTFDDPEQILKASQEAINRKQEIDRLYEQAHALLQDKRWQMALANINRIKTLDLSFLDPDGVEVAAREGWRREERVSALCEEIETVLDARRYGEAKEKLKRIRQWDPPAGWLREATARAEDGLENESQVAKLYSEARDLLKSKQWQQVLDRMSDIRTRDPEFRDPEGLTEAAQRGYRKQTKIAALVDETEKWIGKNEWNLAQKSIDEIHQLDPKWDDDGGLGEKAQNGIDDQKRKEEARRLYREVQLLTQSKQWAAVLEKMVRIHELDRSFEDDLGIQAKAERKLRQQRKAADLRQKIRGLLLLLASPVVFVAKHWKASLAVVGGVVLAIALYSKLASGGEDQTALSQPSLTAAHTLAQSSPTVTEVASRSPDAPAIPVAYPVQTATQELSASVTGTPVLPTGTAVPPTEAMTNAPTATPTTSTATPTVPTDTPTATPTTTPTPTETPRVRTAHAQLWIFADKDCLDPKECSRTYVEKERKVDVFAGSNTALVRVRNHRDNFEGWMEQRLYTKYVTCP